MRQIQLLNSHKWIRNKIRIDDRTFFHRQCEICGRDLARLAGGDRRWRAVHIGVFDLDFLDEQITQRWVYEACPGHELPEDANHQRMQPTAT